MATRRSIDIIKREMPGAQVVEDTPASDTTKRVIPLAKQLPIETLKARSDIGAGDEPAKVAKEAAPRSELVKVKVGKGTSTDRKPKTYSVIVSGDEDDIIGSQG